MQGVNACRMHCDWKESVNIICTAWPHCKEKKSTQQDERSSDSDLLAEFACHKLKLVAVPSKASLAKSDLKMNDTCPWNCRP